MYKIRKLVKYFYLKNKNIGKKSKNNILFRIKIPILISLSTMKNDERPETFFPRFLRVGNAFINDRAVLNDVLNTRFKRIKFF